MSKGEQTRTAILEHATRLASQVGLEGLTIGRLAQDLDLSKSGLFAHFQSKEALEIQVLEHAREIFVEAVIAPALKQPRGEARVRALMDRWIEWGKGILPGGCIFAAASFELDGRPGPVRDALVHSQTDWMDTLTQAVRIAIETKDFSADVDPRQLAYEMYSLVLGFHHARHLLSDPQAEARVRRAFDKLLNDARRRGRKPS